MGVVVATLVLQVALPADMVLHPRWLLPAVSALLVVALLLANPGRMTHFSTVERVISLLLVAAVTAVNAFSAVSLVLAIAGGTIGDRAGAVLVTGGTVYWTNIVAFSLWYWEFDRGGPGRRAAGRAEFPDLQFPQMADPGLAHQDWEPSYLDYLYFSFTNSAAFSPTDVLPLRIWAKMTMMLQAVISLVLAVMVVAWAINNLK
ncbi:hypothetical protein AMES_0256 [Amycolatopsis mediterranei S699]|uniref:DUF1345 domain-containing protein n=3 Tax=Amycolatopsis mediterranei TaxID=33910 RepID=A0A0H3CVX7_AMYMU|nr:DUF1345 domain-containing protein [Amycolatopsis mediterranei]ADJ42084.1 conserved hypothetical protein [Amycolatopsis mediterranei U32]AEK38759.1 hypothetical protein RAM_01320 [Amycolatopsis mediterranei S699]AFO73792.1 hypothetical protein AMES_0256 [Amycolatopsis mediterranei S699]AGT80921.1 hypothetical protein B737_0257 [Amycolatopsis mediterranei RB]KDO08916.1 hypothetical protein DV26_21145 [Amycolatopsis mediterranei]